ncbi:hypothetical protein K2X40_02825 [Candidatus Babeliales bacterium]|nr:hypothetical protein [Candidatus Babeliales bacterium]
MNFIRFIALATFAATMTTNSAHSYNARAEKAVCATLVLATSALLIATQFEMIQKLFVSKEQPTTDTEFNDALHDLLTQACTRLAQDNALAPEEQVVCNLEGTNTAERAQALETMHPRCGVADNKKRCMKNNLETEVKYLYRSICTSPQVTLSLEEQARCGDLTAIKQLRRQACEQKFNDPSFNVKTLTYSELLKDCEVSLVLSPRQELAMAQAESLNLHHSVIS